MRTATLQPLLLLLPTLLLAQQRPPIIDMHMHARVQLLRGPDNTPLARPCNPQPCTGQPPAFTEDDGPLKGTLAAMDRYNIVLGFLSDARENVDQWVAAAPGRFVPSVAWTADFPDLAMLRDAYAAGRLKGMGEIATQYASIAPNDSRLMPYFALAEQFDVPVLIHTLGIGAPLPGFRSALGHPLALEDVLVRHPRLRLYVEDCGWPFLDEMIALMNQYPQVYCDLSTITWIIPRPAFHRYLQMLVEGGLGKRLMFGSDQMQWPETIGLAIEAIETATVLTQDQRRDIFYNNAVSFLRLDPRRLKPVP